MQYVCVFIWWSFNDSNTDDSGVQVMWHFYVFYIQYTSIHAPTFVHFTMQWNPTCMCEWSIFNQLHVYKQDSQKVFRTWESWCSRCKILHLYVSYYSLSVNRSILESRGWLTDNGNCWIDVLIDNVSILCVRLNRS